jgi:hypothetical protein
MEIWKDIKGYEGLYQVSNLGRVKSKERRVNNHRCGATRNIREIVMNPWDNGNGYLVVSLNNKGNRKNHYVHRLVAEHFIENPFECKYINHLDYNKHNNNADNLQWCTQAENVAYSVERMRKPRTICRKSNTGEKYISSRAKGGKTIHYRVRVKGVEKTFKTLPEAIKYRNEVMQIWQNQ